MISFLPRERFQHLQSKKSTPRMNGRKRKIQAIPHTLVILEESIARVTEKLGSSEFQSITGAGGEHIKKWPDFQIVLKWACWQMIAPRAWWRSCWPSRKSTRPRWGLSSTETEPGGPQVSEEVRQYYFFTSYDSIWGYDIGHFRHANPATNEPHAEAQKWRLTAEI